MKSSVERRKKYKITYSLQSMNLRGSIIYRASNIRLHLPYLLLNLY